MSTSKLSADWWKTTVEPVAETHFMLRPVLVNALKTQKLTEDAKKLAGQHETYADLWHATLADRFFDMGTMIRLGTAIETSLRDYYRGRLGLATLTALTTSQGVFQRLEGNNSVVMLYQQDLGYDLKTNPELTSVREAMHHRHLYALRAGLLDDKYIAGLKNITGEDTLPAATAEGYPNQDVYWFKPLRRAGRSCARRRRLSRTSPRAQGAPSRQQEHAAR